MKYIIHLVHHQVAVQASELVALNEFFEILLIYDHLQVKQLNNHEKLISELIIIKTPDEGLISELINNF